MRFMRMLGVFAVVLAVALPAAATGKSKSQTHQCGTVSRGVGQLVAVNISCKTAKNAIANNFAGYHCIVHPQGPIAILHFCKKNGHPGKYFRYLSR